MFITKYKISQGLMEIKEMESKKKRLTSRELSEDLLEEILTSRELSEELLEEILTWMPAECLCKFRSVCKQWNALISSTQFIATKWAEKPPNRMPWLVMISWPFKCLSYCFSTGVWKKNPSILLSFDYEVSYLSYGLPYFRGSSAGLILQGDNRCNTVWNPLTRTSLKLPPMSSIRSIRSRCIVAGERDSPDAYKVIMMGLDRQNARVVEIYHSTTKSWTIAPYPRLVLDDLLMPYGEMVFCSGSAYYLANRLGIWDIVGFDITDGTSISAPLPTMRNHFIRPTLVVCGLHILFADCLIERNTMQIIIWEFEKLNVDSSSPRWKEIGRMPPLYKKEGFTNCLNPLTDGVGLKDWAYFLVNPGEGATEMVVYSVADKTWSLLPRCPLAIESDSFMAFEPRPDMKVQ